MNIGNPKYNVTFKPGTPGGYEGTHFFDNDRERGAFLDRFTARIGPAWEWMVDPVPKTKPDAEVAKAEVKP